MTIVLLVKDCADGRELVRPFQLVVWPSTANPTLTWPPDHVETIVALASPLNETQELTCGGLIADADVQMYLEGGWLVRPPAEVARRRHRRGRGVDPRIPKEPPMSNPAPVITVSLAEPTDAAIVTPVTHPDFGYLALQRGDAKYLTLDPGDPSTTLGPSLRWSDSAGSWERFLDGGSCWIAPRDGQTFMLAKGMASAA